MTLRKQVVDKHCSMPDKTIITNRHQFTYEAMRLNSCPFANHNTTLNLHERTDERRVADQAFIQVYRLDQCNILTKLNFADGDNVTLWQMTRVLTQWQLPKTDRGKLQFIDIDRYRLRLKIQLHGVSECNSAALGLNAVLGCFENANHTQSRFSVCDRCLVLLNAFHKVTHHCLQRL